MIIQPVVYFFGVLFVLTAVLHLAGCIRENTQLANATKPFLMPLLMAVSVTMLMPCRPQTRIVMLLTAGALAAGTAGDIFLMAENTECFFAGIASFLAGHICWICVYAAAFRLLPVPCFAAGIFICIMFIFSAYLLTGKPGGATGAGIICYASVLCALVFTGAVAWIIYKNVPAILYGTGAVLFLISDTMLGYTYFRRQFHISQFLIMLTYIAAQVLLAAGSVLHVVS